MAKNAFTRADDGVDPLSLSGAVIGCAFLLFLINLFIMVQVASGINHMLLDSLPADTVAGLIYLIMGVLTTIAIDAKTVSLMFLPFPDSTEHAGKLPPRSPTAEHPTLQSSRERLAGSLKKTFVTLNYMASHGVVLSAAKIMMFNKARNYSLQFPTYALMKGIIVGDVDLMAFTREGSDEYWESMYGQLCAMYLVTVFILLVACKSWRRGILMILAVLGNGVFSGYFGEQRRMWTTLILLCWLGVVCVSSMFLLAAPSGTSQRLFQSMCRSGNVISDYRADIATVMPIVFQFNVILGVVLTVVYMLGKDTLPSFLLIYVPPTMAFSGLLRNKQYLAAFSTLVAIVHGLAHVFYPFLDEFKGVVKEVDVWQDQAIHMLQAAIFQYMWWDQNLTVRICASIFTVLCVANIAAGYVCWGKSCHEIYVWLSLSAATASGIHAATGYCIGQARNVQWCAQVLQGVSAILTYFMFKGSDDILKLFAQCRFFELYFISAHVLGFLKSGCSESDGRDAETPESQMQRHTKIQ